MDWAKAFAEMWERLWDNLIYPLLAYFGYEVVDGAIVKKDAE